ncbi:ArsR/SmtB family transcription factor [Nonomuraea glycinis]|uniref:ArsR/SmtB family transcription factor n=1 Tax=Nonomuraea glycinis TaxID=2047744 RepID=UPI0033A1A10E
MLFHPATEDIQLTEVLRALSDPVRLEIVALLTTAGELTCGDASVRLSVHKSTASHHFRILREAGVVRTTPKGRLKLLSVRHDDLEARFPGLLGSVVSAVSATHAA